MMHQEQFEQIVQWHGVIHRANTELVKLYWKIGHYIDTKVESAEWGQGIVDSLAAYLKKHYPQLRGFSARNLWRMKQFHQCYCQRPKLSTVLTEISWSHHTHLLSKTKTVEEKEFYIRLTLERGYSSRELARQIDSGLYERSQLRREPVLPAIEQKADLTKIFRDKYVFEFLDLPASYSEREFQKALLANLKSFLLELGKDFTFIAEEYRLQVGGNDYYIDLLFYHRELSCLVALELKVDDFKPEYVGKMNFYLEALDRQVKKVHENPSVGVILCKSADQEIVEIALSRNLSPTLVSEYETKLIDKQLLRRKLHEFSQLQDRDETE